MCDLSLDDILQEIADWSDVEEEDDDVVQCLNDSNATVNMDLTIDAVQPINDEKAGCSCTSPELRRERDRLVCIGCGAISDNRVNEMNQTYSIGANTTCNVSTGGSMAIRAVGRNSYRVQKTFFKTIADYSKQREKSIIKIIIKWDTHSKRHHIPRNVIKEGVAIFLQIKKAKRVYRNLVKHGMLSACLYYACYRNGITKTPTEIARFSGILDKYHSKADRELHSLCELGIIELPLCVNPTRHYVKRYMNLLSIPMMYMDFMLDIIDRAERKFIHIRYNSRNNTKCVGAIWMLVNRIETLRNRITKEMMEQRCDISKTTFIRYYDVVLRGFPKLLRKSFILYNIPMEHSWIAIFAKADAKKRAQRRMSALSKGELTIGETTCS